MCSRNTIRDVFPIRFMTPEGRRAFRAMARAHEGWIAAFFANLAPADIEALMRLLAKTKASARDAISTEEPR